MDERNEDDREKKKKKGKVIGPMRSSVVECTQEKSKRIKYRNVHGGRVVHEKRKKKEAMAF